MRRRILSSPLHPQLCSENYTTHKEACLRDKRQPTTLAAHLSPGTAQATSCPLLSPLSPTGTIWFQDSSTFPLSSQPQLFDVKRKLSEFCVGCRTTSDLTVTLSTVLFYPGLSEPHPAPSASLGLLWVFPPGKATSWVRGSWVPG